jgi:hypothetical protein
MRASATTKSRVIQIYGLLAVVLTASTADGTDPVFAAEEILARINDCQLILTSIGVSKGRGSIDAVLHRESLRYDYGHDLKRVAYIPALALVGRLRLGELTMDPSHQRDVERIVEPYVDGKQSTTVTSGSGLSGHLVFAELASRTEGETRARYVMLSRNAADLAFDSDGRLQPMMPYHNEMSDSLFMGGPILAHVGQLTGDDRYFEACMNHYERCGNWCCATTVCTAIRHWTRRLGDEATVSQRWV